MGLKAGWLALFIFVWLIGAYLGSTYDYQSSTTEAGIVYTTGTANFTHHSATVAGAGTTWVSAMNDGLIRCNANGVWYKILNVSDTTHLTLYSYYNGTTVGGSTYAMKPSEGWVGSAEGTGGYAESPRTTLETIMQAKASIQRNPIVGTIQVVVNGEFWSAVYKIMTWQWSFMLNPDGTMAYGMFYWLFLFPFVTMGFLSVLLMVYGIVTGNLTWS